MKTRITVITLGVDDLEKSLKFYRDGLGLSAKILAAILAAMIDIGGENG